MNVRMTLALVMAVLLTAGCGGGSARGTPRVVTAVVTNDQTTKAEKTVFTPDTPRIFVFFTIADVPANTTMKSIWIAENAQGFQPNEKMDEATLPVGGNVTEGNFNFRRDEPWPNGSYRVEIYIGETLAHTARFRVEGVSANPEAMIPPVGPAPASGPAGRLGAILFARGQSDNDPVQPTTQFEEGVGAAYAFFNFADLEPTDVVAAVWTKDGQRLLEQKATLAEIFTGRTPPRRGHLWFSITFPSGARPGTLNIDLSLNGTAAQSGSVVISGSAGAPAATPEAGLATPSGAMPFGPILFARGESNTQPVERGDRFPRGIKAIYAFFNYQGLKPEHVVGATWYRGDEKLLEQQVKMADLFKGSPREEGHLWFSITFQQGAPTGSYRLLLFFNGAPAIEGTFTVE
ncbi:MAG TPA: hypothetical protein VGR25_01245 [bacterium]|nr:hypothetical protein [bacterium]